MNGDHVLWLHVAATATMVGVGWFVQVVHYPLFLLVGESSHESHHRAHMKRTAWVVAPLMVLEVSTALMLIFHQSLFTRPDWFVASLGMLAALWVSTFAVQVPFHRKLEDGYDRRTIQWLVGTNWLRTVLWTARLGALWAACHTGVNDLLPA
ncbi:MAG: hypothetical protein ACFCUX_01955 [Candidatus Methylacidiphilales bacterium]